MPTILAAAPMIGRPPVQNGQRTVLWTGLLYVPGQFDHGPRVRPARLDAIIVERDGTRRGNRHGAQHVIVVTGPPRIPDRFQELHSARPLPSGVIESGTRASGGESAEHRRLTRPLRNVDDIDRDFTLARSTKTTEITPRCVHCGRFEACPCDLR